MKASPAVVAPLDPDRRVGCGVVQARSPRGCRPWCRGRRPRRARAARPRRRARSRGRRARPGRASGRRRARPRRASAIEVAVVAGWPSWARRRRLESSLARRSVSSSPAIEVALEVGVLGAQARRLQAQAQPGERGAQLVRGVGDEVALGVERAHEPVGHVVEGVGDLDLLGRAGRRGARAQVARRDLARRARQAAQRTRQRAGDRPREAQAERQHGGAEGEQRDDVAAHLVVDRLDALREAHGAGGAAGVDDRHGGVEQVGVERVAVARALRGGARRAPGRSRAGSRRACRARRRRRSRRARGRARRRRSLGRPGAGPARGRARRARARSVSRPEAAAATAWAPALASALISLSTRREKFSVSGTSSAMIAKSRT